MKRILVLLLLFSCIVVQANALEISAPVVPESGRECMPENSENFGEALLELFEKGRDFLLPELKNALKIHVKILCIILLFSILHGLSDSGKLICNLAGNIAITSALIGNAGTMITLGIDTIQEISDYGKLLLPVMTAALAAQGGITSSTALYAGTALFNSVLTELIVSLLIPGIRLYLVVSLAGSISGEDILKRMSDFLKNSMTWILKTLMMVFTTYMGISGVISGTTDAAALKAAKVTISSVVPMVGNILSEASEAVLVSAGIVKNTAGIYGILAVLAVFLHPFLRILTHYISLKLTAALSAVFGNKSEVSLIDSFSTVMGLLLAVTGSCCMMVLISTICFMRSTL